MRNKLSYFFGTISNIAFVLLLLAFVLKNFQSLSAETFKMLSLIAWGSLAMASLFEGLFFQGKNKVVVLFAGLSISATAILILSRIMDWRNFGNLQYAPYACLIAGVLLLIFQRNLSSIATKALIIGTIGLLMIMGKL